MLKLKVGDYVALKRKTEGCTCSYPKDMVGFVRDADEFYDWDDKIAGYNYSVSFYNGEVEFDTDDRVANNFYPVKLSSIKYGVMWFKDIDPIALFTNRKAAVKFAKELKRGSWSAEAKSIRIIKISSYSKI